MTVTHNAPAGARTWRSLAPLLLDAGVPTAAYYLLRGLGVDVVPALAASAVLAGLRTVWGWRRGGRDPVAMLVLVFALVGIATSFVLGSPRLMLAKEELGIIPLGGWLLVRGLRGRPLAGWFRPWLARTSAENARWDALIDRPGPLRHHLAVATAVWGTTFLATSAVRLTLIAWLPVDQAVVASQLALPVGILAGVLATVPATARARRALVDGLP
jgi:hypothetical protein